MNNEKEVNIQKNNNIQYFGEFTYYAIEPFSKVVNFGF